METSSVVAALTTLVLFVYAWWWAVNWKHHDDDDDVYTAFFDPKVNPVATPHAFVKILERMPKGSRILDLGVGSGVYLEHEPVHRVLRERKLFVDGVDISAPNVAICQERIKVQGLQAHFSAVCQDARTLDAEGKYDAILFMESFPVMSKSLFLDIFKSVQRFLKPGTGVNCARNPARAPQLLALRSHHVVCLGVAAPAQICITILAIRSKWACWPRCWAR